MRPPLHVLITVDTEVWPRSPLLFGANPSDDIRRDIFGETECGDFGLCYKIDVLDRHGLKAVFMLESLFASVGGLEPLSEVVEAVQSRGHEVQLHLHPEWLSWMSEPILPGRTGMCMKAFTEDEQTALLERGLDNLRAAGAQRVCAFRAGNYGADLATLRALARTGIAFDTSYNQCYLDSACGLRFPEPLLQPRQVEGVCEVPITFFWDFPCHRRHAQLCACSFREMRSALLQAYAQGWRTFVIVSHSFELLRRRGGVAAPVPDGVVIRRFEQLCSFLAEHSDMFQTTGFCDLDPLSIARPIDVEPRSELRSNVLATGLRYIEQAGRHFQSLRAAPKRRTRMMECH